MRNSYLNKLVICLFVVFVSVPNVIWASEVAAVEEGIDVIEPSQQELLLQRKTELEGLLEEKDLARDDEKAFSKELRAVKKELKNIEREQKKAARAAEKAEKARLAALKKQYGDGPYPDEIAAYADRGPEPLRPFLSSLYVEGERNAVLNFDRIGVAAFETGHDDFAKWALDNALLRIESIYADDPAAKLAKSKFAKEKVKDFKGEPYERAMAYYYRGLLYLKHGDYQNARASFKSAEFQDTMSDLEDFEADFAVLNFLSGWASACDGDSSLADEYYQQALKFNPGLKIPAPEHNVLLIAETGMPPVKVTEGKHDEILKFYPNENFAEESARFTVVQTGGNSTWEVDAMFASSTYNQATTRGGRPIDGLLEGKASFKEGMSTAGDVMAATGLAAMQASSYSGNDDLAGAGAVVALGGLLFKGISNAMKPEADSRYWDNLPDDISINTLKLDDIESTAITVTYLGDGAALPDDNSPAVVADPGACSIVWARSRSALDVNESAPNARLTAKENKKQKKDIKAKEDAFRKWLLDNTPGEIT